MPNRISVSSAEFIRNIGYWQNEALRQPLSITHHGRERLVLAAPDVLAPQEGGGDASKSLAALRADVAAVQANLGDGYLSFDQQLCIRHSNAVAESLIGLSHEDLVGTPILNALPQPMAPVLCDRVQRVIRTRQTERFEVGAGDDRHFAITVFAVAAGAAALIRNATEVHTLRRRLEDGEAMQRVVNTHSCAALIKLDVRARIESIDETFTQWSGFGAADLLGHRVVDLVAVPQRREAGEMIERVLRERQPRQMELDLLSKRGEEIPGVLALAPILTDFAAHGAFALFIPRKSATSSQQAA